MIGIITAAGYATRLGSLTRYQPKHLLPVAGVPMINYLMEQIIPLNFEQIYLVTNNRFAKHFRNWLSYTPWEDKIIILNDGTNSNEDRLGSIGDMQFAIDAHQKEDDALIFNADVLTNFDFDTFIATFHKSNLPTICLFDVKDIERAKRHGNVSVNKQNQILTFEEKPEHPKSTLVSTGFYLLPKAQVGVLKSCIENGKHDASGFMVEELLKQSKIFGVIHDGYSFDIGTPDTYLAAQEYFDRND